MAYDEDLADRIRATVASEEGLSEQKMFGGLAFLINGNMAIAASGGGGILVRFDPTETDRQLRLAHTEPFVMQGRTMEGWIRVAQDGTRTKRQLERWARLGVDYTRTLPKKR